MVPVDLNDEFEDCAGVVGAVEMDRNAAGKFHADPDGDIIRSLWRFRHGWDAFRREKSYWSKSGCRCGMCVTFRMPVSILVSVAGQTCASNNKMWRPDSPRCRKTRQHSVRSCAGDPESLKI